MVEILRAEPSDWRLVRDIRLRALADSPDSFSRMLAEEQAYPDELWRERLQGTNPTFVAVHERRGVAMGGVIALPEDPEGAMVWGMWTDPAFRGEGLGRRILELTIGWAQDAGRTPYLQVTEGNDDARALYVSCGFEPTGGSEELRSDSDLQCAELVLRRG